MVPAILLSRVQRQSTRRVASPRSSSKSGRLLATTAVLGGLLFGTSTSIEAQTAQFVDAESTIPTSTLINPYGVAVDGSGNVYIANSNLGTVLKETLTSSGTYTETTIASGLYSAGIAVDASGNLYVLDNSNNRAVKETLSGGAYSQSTITSDLSTPTAIAVDSSGDVYITEDAYLLKEAPSGSSYTQSQAITGYSFNGIAVDAGGNLFLTQYSNLLKGTLSGGSYTLSIIDSSFGGATGVAVDSNGLV
jgi:streptogramin lyase